ncbi:MAG: hypothetical protein FJ295_10275 [Planctomycetes bacterium]|nr:hypothetical protein [Planctomycetota bacterium]
MANARVPGTVDPTRHPQQLKDGTLALQESSVPRSIGTATKAAKGAKSYPDHLQKELNEQLIGLFTKDVISGVLNAAAFGFKD